MVTIADAELTDAETILALQKLAFQSEARRYNDWTLAPLRQTVESLREQFAEWVVLKATLDGRIVGSVRARRNGDTCAIGWLVVHPEFQRQGIGSQLLRDIETKFRDVSRYELFTGSKSEGNIRLYQRHGYSIIRTQIVSATLSLVFLEKRARHETEE